MIATESTSVSGQLSHFPHWKWTKQCLLSGVSALSIIACWRDTQQKHCIYCCDSLKLRCLFMLIWIEWNVCILLHVAETCITYSGMSKVCWGECLLLVLSHAGETHNISTAPTAVTHWKWNTQYLFILSGTSALSIIAACWRYNTSTVASTLTHWKWNKRYLLLLLSGVSALSIIAVFWRDMQHKHCIYYRDSLKVEQTVIYIERICLHIAACWRGTQHKHCIYCDSLKMEQTVAIECSVCT